MVVEVGGQEARGLPGPDRNLPLRIDPAPARLVRQAPLLAEDALAGRLLLLQRGAEGGAEVELALPGARFLGEGELGE